MPWDANNPPRPSKNWSKPAQTLCIRVANAVLKKSGNDQQAIFACIHAVRQKYPSEIKGKADEELEDFSWFDTQTDEQLRKLEADNPDLFSIIFAPIPSATRSGLPDSAFAIVYSPPNGTKIRALPHHTASGAVDLNHLRNALARWNQVKGVPANIKRAGLRHLEAHARKAGVGDKKAAADFLTDVYSLEGITFEQTGEGESSRYVTKGLIFAVAGKFVHPWFGEVDLSEPVLRELKRNFDKRVLGTDVAIDERHDRGRAMGWVKDVTHPKKVSLNGKDYTALLGDVEWTAEGRKLLEDKIYKYFSPEFGTYTEPDGKTQHNNVLLGGALTNRPFLKMMPSVKFSDQEAKGTATNVITFDEGTDEGEDKWEYDDDTSEVKPLTHKLNNDILLIIEQELQKTEENDEEDDEVKLEDLLKQINDSLGGSVKFESVDALVSALKAGAGAQQSNDQLKEKLKAAGITFDDKTAPTEAAATIIAAQADQIKSLNESVSGIAKTLQEQKRDVAVGALINQRKIKPADKEKYDALYDKDATLFESVVGTLTTNESLPVIGQIGGPGPSTEPGEGVEFSDPVKAEEKGREYLKLIGITPKSEALTGGKK
jgi:hypothetical protein